MRKTELSTYLDDNIVTDSQLVLHDDGGNIEFTSADPVKDKSSRKRKRCIQYIYIYCSFLIFSYTNSKLLNFH